MLALSIRQPYAELILRGIKRIEYRRRATRIIARPFYIYVPKGATPPLRDGTEAMARRIWSDDLAVPGGRAGEPPPWLMELAELLILDKLPRGVIVGQAVIERCVPATRSGFLPSSLIPLPCMYEWHLSAVERATRLRRPSRHPQPMWFKPF